MFIKKKFFSAIIMNLSWEILTKNFVKNRVKDEKWD